MTPSLLARKQSFYGLLAVFVLLGVVYAVTTPIFEASDELWHYPFVRHLADGNPLPVQDPQNVGPWKQEASQQPLYYAIAAALTFWIDTSDMVEVRWLNPHVDNGVLTPDGNNNLIVHRPGQESFPWHGTVLAVRLIRLLSVLMGAGTVYFTWRIAHYVFPGRPDLALAAAAVNAFTPMFLFISGAVNNDNLSMLLCTMALWLILRNGERTRAAGGRLDWRDSLTLGLVLGLAALTKTSALGLIPLSAMALLLAGRQLWRKAGWRRWFLEMLKHGLLLVLPVLAIAGWWYLRNLRLYGDWLGWSAFIDVLGQRAHPANLRQLWGERWGFSLSYWGLFGGVNVPMPTWIYHTLNALAVLGFFGLVLFVFRIVKRQWDAGRHSGWLWQTVDALWPTALLAGWTVAIFMGLVRWATTTWSSQGRLVFPAIAAISILLVAGLSSWLPRKTGRWGIGMVVALMAVVAAVAPLAWIAPAYRPVGAPDAAELAAIQNPLDVELGGRMQLLGYDLSAATVAPGEDLELTLYWQVLAPMTRNWSVFVHLNDPVIGAPVAQRDMYPGQGLLATTLLEPNQVLVDRYVIQVPETTYAPADAELVVGLYIYGSDERLQTGDGNEVVALTPVQIQSDSATSLPNPLDYNFGDQMALVGYSVEPRRLLAGEELVLTLYWQAAQALDHDYTVFTHVLDLEDPSNRIFGQQDAPPGETSSWQPGEVVEATYHLTLAEDTPPGVHVIEVGVYYRDEDGSIQRLQLLTADGRLVDDYLIVGRLRVD